MSLESITPRPSRPSRAERPEDRGRIDHPRPRSSALAAFAAMAVACSASPGLGTEGITTQTMTTEPLGVAFCNDFATRGDACGWSMQATVGCAAALRTVDAELMASLESCLGTSDCAAAQRCVDDVLLGMHPPAVVSGMGGGGGGGGTTAPDPADAGPDVDASDGGRATIACTGAVPFADPACLSCMGQSCCAASAKCNASSDCVDVLSCVYFCGASDPSCEASCEDGETSAVTAAYRALRTCRATACDTTCPEF